MRLRIGSMLIGAAVLASAYFCARGVGLLVAGTLLPLEPRTFASPSGERTVSPESDAVSSVERIVRSALFTRTQPEPAPPPQADDPPTLATDPRCPGRLVGVLRDARAPARSLASVVDPTGEHRLYRGDHPDVARIDSDRVVLKTSDRTCELRLFDDAPADVTLVSTQRDRGTRATRDAIAPGGAGRPSAADIRSVRAVPRGDGMALYGIRRGSFLDRIGVRNGDLIQTVDGRPATDTDAMLSLYAAFTAGTLTSADVTLTRHGEPLTLRYALE